MNYVLEELGNIGIIPVIKIDDKEKAVPLAKALMAGGLPCAEVTFRTDAAEEAISLINREVPEILLGAGTVLNSEQADRAINAGAKFIVSPGFNPKLVSHCIEKNIPVIPGCSSPSDIEAAIELGLDVVKFFPAEQAGGLEYIKAVSAPYTSMKFIPTGGINAKNIAEYIKFNKILACGGSWMVRDDLINAGDFDKITSLCREAIFNMLGFECIHLGINSENEDECRKNANTFASLFGFTNRETPAAIFSSEQFEIMKSMGRGTKGHIAIGTNSVSRAWFYLCRQGVIFDDNTRRYDAAGNFSFIYIKDEINGFAVHLILKT